MKILVAGGNGYIGSHTLIQLIKSHSFEVVSIDNLSRSQLGTMDRIEKITGKKVMNYNMDLCDKNALFSVIEKEDKIDGIIHFAAFKSVPESIEKPYKYYKNNINSLTNLLDACEQFHIQHFIFSSSCSVYGKVATLPVTEETPIGKALSPYAHTKQIGEDIIQAYAHQHSDFKAIILRYFNPIGADMSGQNGEIASNEPHSNLMQIIMQTVRSGNKTLTVYGKDYDTRDGSCIRDYIHVTDIADAHVKAIEASTNGTISRPCEIFNLGTGQGITVLEILNAFEKITGKKLNYKIGPRRAGDLPAIYSDSKKAKQILGWECKYNVEDMILSAWKWEQELFQHL